MRWDRNIGPPIEPPKIGSCLGPARRAGVAAQALKGHRAGPALNTIDRALGRVRVVLFRVVPHVVNRAWPIWNTIADMDGNGSGRGRVEVPRTRPRNPNSKPAPNPKPHSGENLAPTPKPAGARNPPGTPKPASTPPSSTSSAPPRCCHQLLLNELEQRPPDLASELHPAARRSPSPTLELLLFDGGAPPVASFGAGAPPRRLLRAAGKLRHRVESGAVRRESRGGRPRRPTSGRLPGRRAAAEGERERGGRRAARSASVGGGRQGRRAVRPCGCGQGGRGG
jgi:hypothetical protein